MLSHHAFSFAALSRRTATHHVGLRGKSAVPVVVFPPPSPGRSSPTTPPLAASTPLVPSGWLALAATVVLQASWLAPLLLAFAQPLTRSTHLLRQPDSRVQAYGCHSATRGVCQCIMRAQHARCGLASCCFCHTAPPGRATAGTASPCSGMIQLRAFSASTNSSTTLPMAPLRWYVNRPVSNSAASAADETPTDWLAVAVEALPLSMRRLFCHHDAHHVACPLGARSMIAAVARSSSAVTILP